MRPTDKEIIEALQDGASAMYLLYQQSDNGTLRMMYLDDSNRLSQLSYRIGDEPE